MVGKMIIAQPHGFCAGVKNAINVLDMTLENFDKVYCLHELVHNPFVVNDFKEKGVVFVNKLEEVPDNSVIVFSAHSVSPNIRELAKKKNLQIIDATCPLVELVHKKVRAYHKDSYNIIYIGKKGHIEVEGILGEAPMHVISSVEDVDNLNLDNEKIVCLTQTTLSVDDTKNIIDQLRQRFPDILVESGICNATQQRQDAVKELAKKCDLILVLGARNSSNSQRLVETAKKQGVNAYLILDRSEINEDWLKNVKTLGITSGASCPEFLLTELVNSLKSNKNFLNQT